MKCAECNLWGADYYGDVPYCHADPNWPAPCEYDDEPIEDCDDFAFFWEPEDNYIDNDWEV